MPPCKFGCQHRQSVILAKCPAIFDCNILALDSTGFRQPPTERVHKIDALIGRPCAQKTNCPHRLSLRPNDHRQNRPTEKGDELPSPHSITSSARASSVGG